MPRAERGVDPGNNAYMSYSFKLLKGGYLGDCMGGVIKGIIKVDTRSLDSGSYRPLYWYQYSLLHSRLSTSMIRAYHLGG